MVTSSVVIFITINIIKVPKLEDLVKKKKKKQAERKVRNRRSKQEKVVFKYESEGKFQRRGI